ncbi:MAG: transglutaminase-like domain-containing protein [Spirochaetaceae bacterium]|jgi:transglutaminase-like putative cysteine protease|nr:transglutaminase-like domain-containing protein [Spirochaetaceae bacterium]
MNSSHTFWNRNTGKEPEGICRYPVKAVVFFFLRLLFPAVLAVVLTVHPAVTVDFDYEFVIVFILCPLESLIAFLPAPKGRFRYKLILAALAALGVPMTIKGYPFDLSQPDYQFLYPLAAAAVCFVFTLLLFHYPRWGKPAVLEPFFFSFLFLRILRFSRAGEEIAEKSEWITPFVLGATLLVFLLYSAVVYSCLYPAGAGMNRREGIAAALGIAALSLFMAFVPTDFVRNTVITNLLENRADEMTKESDYEWGIEKDGGTYPHGRKTVPGDNGSDPPGLRELSEYDWPGQGDGKGKGKGKGNRKGDGSGGSDVQYTVMVAASQTEPVYMGDTFMGLFDPLEGFQPTPEEPLNTLPFTRLLSTWVDQRPAPRRGRVFQEVFSLSTLSQNFLPYRPVEVEPTVLSRNTGPLRFIHRVRSFMYERDPLDLAAASVRELRESEKAGLSLYLEADLRDEDRLVFAEHLAGALKEAESAGYAGTVAAILRSFAGFQYNVTDDEDASVPALTRFLTDTREGDCVQFAHSAALLGRLAGIPSRVVTGYLASASLQTKAHRRGLAALRSQIKALQEFPFEDLFLVTTAHAHAWPQFYLPDYGWLDFEATMFALPPMGFGDGNLRDVVIPRIEENPSPARSFPWRGAGKVLALLGAAALAGAYAVRYGREVFLVLCRRRGGRRGARALYLLLLARLASDGKPFKPDSKTASEYAGLFPDSDPSLRRFAALYSEIRWRYFETREAEDARFRDLAEEYRRVLKTVLRRGVRFRMVRAFSLRALRYV